MPTHPSSLTQEALIGGLERLINKKSFEEISISKLTQIAGISRTTFYRNYHNIVDVLNYQIKLLLEEFNSSIKYEGDNYSYIFQVITFFDQYRGFIRLLLKANRQDLLLQKVAGVMEQLVAYNPHLDNFSKVKLYYFIEYHTTGLMSVILDWIKNEEPETTEELAAFLTENINS